MSFQGQILTILNNSKRGNELPLADAIGDTDFIIFYNNTTGQLERISKINFNATFNFPFVVITQFGQTFRVKKAAAIGVADVSILEAGDRVWELVVVDAEDDDADITLNGDTYNGGTGLDFANYSMENTYSS